MCIQFDVIMMVGSEIIILPIAGRLDAKKVTFRDNVLVNVKQR